MTQLSFLVPGPTEIEQVFGQCCHGAVKLAPATEVPDAWADRAELEWIGNRRECRQLVAWFGGLARRPGGRCATVLDRTGDGAETLFGSPDAECAVATRISRFVHDPHNAVRAVRLTGALADQFGLQPLSVGEGYLTADSPLVTSFEVIEELPFDMRRVKAMLRLRSIGQLEIKQRGVSYNPRELNRALKPCGDNIATLLITSRNSGVITILARCRDQKEPT